MNTDDFTALVAGRHLPQPTAESEAFWRGGETGRLLIRRCDACTRLHHPPQPLCPSCGSWDVRAIAVSGYGKVVSFTVNRQSWLPRMVVPFVIAYVELAEQTGIWLMTNIVNCEPGEVSIGLQVQCRFVRHDDVWLPVFEPRPE